MQNSEPSRLSYLSTREAEIAALAASGLNVSEIAARLFLSVNTVKTHLSHIYEKCGVNNRVELTRWLALHSEAGTPHNPENA